MRTMKKLMTFVVLCFLVVSVTAQEKIKSGLTPEDWAYKMAEGVTAKEVTYYSDGVGCYAKIFIRKDFLPAVRRPA